MHNLKTTAAVLSGLLLLGTSAATFAEPYGLLIGRSADISRSPDRSFEAGMGFGEFDDVDYEHFGGRFNYKVNPTTVAYGDIGQSTLEDADGLTFGFGGFWQMDGIFENSEFGLHASFHSVDLDLDDSDASVSGNSIQVEGVFSSREAINAAGSMYFYGSLGINRSSLKAKRGNRSSSTETDTELTFSGGVFVQTQSKGGELYAGVFYLDDLGFGAGYRHYLK